MAQADCHRVGKSNDSRTDILDPLQIATESRAVSDGFDVFSFVEPADRGLIQTISIVMDNAALFAQQGSYGVAV